MSRIGRLPITIESAVQVSLETGKVSVKGPKGQLEHGLPRGITAKIEDGQLLVSRRDDSKRLRSLHGLTRALLANAVQGVAKGFSKKLEIHGVGYRADVSGRVLKLALGYSHPIEFQIPEGIEIVVEERNTRLTV